VIPLLFLVLGVLLQMFVVAAPASAAQLAAASAAPSVTALNYHWGPATGGKSLVITGTDFTGATAVSFGGTAAATFKVDSPTQITATTPAHAMALVQVQVTTPGGSSADTAADDYNYTIRTEAPTKTIGGFSYYPSVGTSSSAAWRTFGASGASGGSYERSSKSGSYVTVKFTGSYLVWITTAGTTTGTAKVSLDGGTEVAVNLARSITNYQSGVWETPPQLTNGAHTVKITWAGPAGKYIGIDAVDVVGTIDAGPPSATVITHGSRDVKNVALTFDMGGRLTPALAIMQWLIDNQVHATIFATGETGTTTSDGPKVLALIKAHPELFDLGNHSWDHPYFTKLNAAQMQDQITRAEAALAPLAGQSTKPWFRPPYMAYNSSVTAAVAAAGWSYMVLEDFSTLDWKPVSEGGPTTSAIVNKVNSLAQGGSIIGMHLGGYNTLDALPGILKVLKAKGLQPVTLSEMFGL
jgi:peptidoglycan/xylan/chitin deacetylase (PgdA/CDA1 family)